MDINWSQLVTNILGFLLLFWGLKKFAWGKILGQLDQRRETIAKGFREAEEERTQAAALRNELDKQLREVDVSARKKIEEATAEGQRLAGAIKDEARAEARALVEKAQHDIEHERAKARVQLRNDVVSMAMLGAEKILREQIDRETQERLIGQFIDQLESSHA